MKNCFADINNCNNFQYFVTERYTIFFVQVYHLSRRIFDNGIHFVHCHTSEVVWSRLKPHATVKWSSRRWSTSGHFSLTSGHISVPQRLAGLITILWLTGNAAVSLIPLSLLQKDIHIHMTILTVIFWGKPKSREGYQQNMEVYITTILNKTGVHCTVVQENTHGTQHRAKEVELNVTLLIQQLGINH